MFLYLSYQPNGAIIFFNHERPVDFAHKLQHCNVGLTRKETNINTELERILVKSQATDNI